MFQLSQFPPARHVAWSVLEAGPCLGARPRPLCLSPGPTLAGCVTTSLHSSLFICKQK